MKRLGIGLIVLSSVTACGQKSEDNGNSGTTITPGSGKLPLDDLTKPTTLGTLTRADVISYMESSRSDFLATEFEAPDTTEETDSTEEDEVDCLGDAFSSIAVTADGDTLTVNVDMNMAACLQSTLGQGSDGVTMSISKALMSVYIENTCMGADLSSYDGKKMSEMEDPPECDNNLLLMNMKAEMAWTMTADGETVDMSTTSVTATGTAANEPCLTTKSGENYAQDGCVETFMSVNADSSSNEYSKYTHKSLKWVDSTQNTWYSSGSIEVELNDWTGSVTFRGADINPLYTMTYGTETISGTLTVPASGLYFKSALQRAMMRNVPRVPSFK